MIRHLTIPRDTLDLAADLYLPDDFDDSSRLPAVVLSTPGSSVKEQIGANYASRLARHGFAALTFDPAHQGQSGGKPRDAEDPYRRGEDLSYAVDDLSALPGIDPDRIGALGICAGGGYAVHTTRTDHRIKALATVVGTDMGAAWRSAAFAPHGPAAALDELAAARSAEVADGTLQRVNWLPDSLLIGYDAFHLVEELLTQPLLVIVAGREGVTRQYETGMKLWEIAPNPVDLLVVEGAGHYEMYDEPRYVDPAVERLAAFYRDHL